MRGALFEIIVPGEIAGFSRETSVIQHLNMHLKKGEVLYLSSHSLVAYYRCAAAGTGVPGLWTSKKIGEPANQTKGLKQDKTKQLGSGILVLL